MTLSIEMAIGKKKKKKVPQRVDTALPYIYSFEYKRYVWLLILKEHEMEADIQEWSAQASTHISARQMPNLFVQFSDSSFRQSH